MKSIILVSALILGFSFWPFSEKERPNEISCGTPPPTVVNNIAESLVYEIQPVCTKPITEEKLKSAQTLNDIIPYYPSNWIFDYRAVEISIDYDTKKESVSGTNNILNAQQKNMLHAAQIGADISITVDYITENSVLKKREDASLKVNLTLIPKKEAAFPTGCDNLIESLKNQSSVFISKKNPNDYQQLSVLFTISENGKAENVYLNHTSGDTQTDKLFIDLITNMPTWHAAENMNEEKVKQTFEFTFGKPGC